MKRKKKNLYEPDSWHFYWHDLWREQYFSKQQEDGFVMIWAGFQWQRKTDIVFISNGMNARDYHTASYQFATCYKFLKILGYVSTKNALIQAANSTFEWFLSNGSHIIDWSPLSPKLNPTENLWEILEDVYADGIQYNSTSELKQTILSG